MVAEETFLVRYKQVGTYLILAQFFVLTNNLILVSITTKFVGLFFNL